MSAGPIPRTLRVLYQRNVIKREPVEQPSPFDRSGRDIQGAYRDEQAYIVFTASAFALLGLRALFFFVRGLLDRLVYLSTGFALILAFIGVKLILHCVLAFVTVASPIKIRLDPPPRRMTAPYGQTAPDGPTSAKITPPGTKRCG